MNRFVLACRAFADGLHSEPSVTEVKETLVGRVQRSLESAKKDVNELRTKLVEAEQRAAALQTRLEQLNKLPNEAFTILLS